MWGFLPFCVYSILNAQFVDRMISICNVFDGVRVETLKAVIIVNGTVFDCATISGDDWILMFSCRRIGFMSCFELKEEDVFLLLNWRKYFGNVSCR